MTADRTGEAQIVDLPCPRCGNKKVLCYLLTDEDGQHQHTYYVCTFYGRGRRASCGFHGWTVPSERDTSRIDLAAAPEWTV